MRSLAFSLLITVLLAGCKQNPANINSKASLPETLLLDNPEFKVISSVINPQSETMSILFGNHLALESLKAPGSSLKGEKILILITWQQKDELNWFGAKTPSDFVRREVLKTLGGFTEKDKISYVSQQGRNFKKTGESDSRNRIEFITSIQPSVMP